MNELTINLDSRSKKPLYEQIKAQALYLFLLSVYL